MVAQRCSTAGRYAGALALIGCAFAAQAADVAERYPARPIRLVNPYAPGGVTDVTSRIVVPQLVQAWGQQIVIDNRPGAGTNIGTEIVVRAPPDGYTMLATTGAIATNPSFYPNPSFKATRDLAAVVRMADVHMSLALYPNLPAKTFPEFLALARAQPGKLTIASAGTGTSTHLAIELLKTMAKVDVAHVPFKGGGGGIVGVIGGQMSGIITPVTLVQGHHRAGRIRIVAVTTSARSPLASEFPTFAEAGVPGFEANSWVGLFAPRATPQAIIRQWNEAVNRALRTPEVEERFKAAGLVAVGGSEAAFASHFQQDTDRWAALIKAANIAIAP
jgi:tripartite-type tricarboxylate transporter receptor subunit TctC